MLRKTDMQMDNRIERMKQRGEKVEGVRSEPILDRSCCSLGCQVERLQWWYTLFLHFFPVDESLELEEPPNFLEKMRNEEDWCLGFHAGLLSWGSSFSSPQYTWAPGTGPLSLLCRLLDPWDSPGNVPAVGGCRRSRDEVKMKRKQICASEPSLLNCALHFSIWTAAEVLCLSPLSAFLSQAGFL